METTTSPPENVIPVAGDISNNGNNNYEPPCTETTPDLVVSASTSEPVQTEPILASETQPTTQPGPSIKKRRRRKKLFTDMISTSSAASGLRVLRPNPKPSTAYSYSETELAADDSSISTKRRRRMSDLAKEVDVEALIAISVGFPVDSLMEEEIEANVVSPIGGVDQANYIVVRNHILALWRSNVSIWLTKDHAFESIRAEHKHLVHSAYSYLLNHGYINFGLAPAITEAKLTPSASESGPTKATVIVIGAGISGLVAARQLIFLGFKVIVLEGRSRSGGRIRSKKMSGGDDGFTTAAADLGGSVLTGINGNPLGVLARQLGLPLHKVRDICPLYLPNGRSVNPEVDSKVEALFNKLLDRVCKLRQTMLEELKSVDISLGASLETFRSVCKVAEDPLERMLMDWHLANLEYANASLMSNLSMSFWDQDDPYEMGGDHCFIPGGNERLIRALAEDLPIFYDKTVDSVRYGTNGVLVYANGKEYQGDIALCTVPLGVLKKGVIEFVPELPERKKDAISRLGFGLLNKVAILFPYDFWGGEIDTFGHLTDDSDMRGEFFLFYSYSSVSGGPLLIALVAGEAAIRFENMSPGESVRRVLEILKSIFGPKGISVPDPLQAVCTRWGQDEFTYGSYSYVAVGASGDDYDIMSESVGDRLFFAGEATNKQYPATMHGAFLSGMREAAHIMRVAKRKSYPSSENQEVDVELEKLFETPDLEFGGFKVLYDPRSNEMDSNCLVRVAFKDGSGNLHLFGLLSKKQVIELSEVEDDVKRTEILGSDFGVRLGGSKSLCNIAESLITCIKSGKSGMK